MANTTRLRGPDGRFIKSPPAQRNEYDILAERERRHRHTPSIEMTDEAGVFTGYSRLKSVSFLRDLYRNYTQAKSLLWQFRVNCIGQKVLFHTDDEKWNKAAKHWFNSRWAKRCDGRDDRHLDDINAQILLSVIREHDCLGFIDSAGVIPDGKGRIFTWETDQICDIVESQFKLKKTQKELKQRLGLTGPAYANIGDLIQKSGVLCDAYGIVRGYIVTNQHGMTHVKLEDATILTRRKWSDNGRGAAAEGLPEQGVARLFKAPWRLNSVRGTAELLTAAKDLVDSYEMLAAELSSAKTAAHLGIQITKEDAMDVALGRATGGESSTEGSLESTAPTAAYTRYKNFEKLSRGAIQYMEPGEEAKVIQNERPAPDVTNFLTWNAISSGGSMGLARIHSVMKADASYSASRAEGNLSGMTFHVWHKWVERYVIDWEVPNAIFDGIQNGPLAPMPQDKWLGKWSVSHPKPPPIDAVKQARADTEALNNGTKTLEDIIGPEWEEKVIQRGKEIKAQVDNGVFDVETLLDITEIAAPE